MIDRRLFEIFRYLVDSNLKIVSREIYNIGERKNVSIPLIPYDIQKYIMNIWIFEMFKYIDYKAPTSKRSKLYYALYIHFFEIRFTLNLS